MRKHPWLLPVLIMLSACNAPTRDPASLVVPLHNAGLPASCGDRTTLKPDLAAELTQGHAPEASPRGRCVADAAQKGSIIAALLLADIYHQAMSTNGQAPNGSAALGLDVFGRHIRWLRLAAEQGCALAQLQLAQETDSPAYAPMSDVALAWYQTSAKNGVLPALQAIGMAYAQGRIIDERLYDLRIWLTANRNRGVAYREMLRSLGRPPLHFL